MPFTYEKLLEELLVPRGGRPRKVFFAGKGGVGKTTLACTAALFAAERGNRTVLVTTDPASHIGEVFGVEVGPALRKIPHTDLWLVRIDPKAALENYQQAVLATVPDDAETQGRVREELNSPCTEEVAVFQHFLDFVLDDAFDVTVFDTAPTGHTVRLLQLAWDYAGELAGKTALSSETAALDGAQLAPRMQAAIQTLQDPGATSMLFVTLPEMTPIAEMERAIADLGRTGIATQAIIVNEVLPEEAATSPLFGKRLAKQMMYIDDLRPRHPAQAFATAPLQDDEILGVALLQQFGDQLIH